MLDWNKQLETQLDEKKKVLSEKDQELDKNKQVLKEQDEEIKSFYDRLKTLK